MRGLTPGVGLRGPPSSPFPGAELLNGIVVLAIAQMLTASGLTVLVLLGAIVAGLLQAAEEL
jgi:hypothetical protein